MKLLARLPRWLLPLIVGSLASGYALFVQLPRREQQADLHRDLQSRQRFIQQATSLPAQHIRAQQELAATIRYCQEWRGGLPEVHELSDRVAQIAQTAEDSGLHLVRFDQKESVAMTTLVRAPVELSCEGSFPSVVSFLAKLDQMSAPVWVRTLVLEPQEGAEGLVRCDLQILVFGNLSSSGDPPSA